MNVIAERDDAEEFIVILKRFVGNLLSLHSPSTVLLIKIDHWFGSKWLHFAGKTSGSVGVWDVKALSIPPFVPNRVVSQRRFEAPYYDEIDSGKSVHLQVTSSAAILRRIAQSAPGSMVVWYSGDSELSGRGSVMAYAPGKTSTCLATPNGV